MLTLGQIDTNRACELIVWRSILSFGVKQEEYPMNKPPTPVPPISIPPMEVPQDLKPVYSNMARLSHLPAEIVFDFALKVPGPENPQVMARVIMSPLSAKLLHRALTENLSKYEAVFGEIRIPNQTNDKSLEEYSKLFRPPQPPQEQSHEPPRRNH